MLENVVKRSECGYTREQRYTKAIYYYSDGILSQAYGMLDLWNKSVQMSEHAVSKSYCVEMAGFLLIFVCVWERRGDFVFCFHLLWVHVWEGEIFLFSLTLLRDEKFSCAIRWSMGQTSFLLRFNASSLPPPPPPHTHFFFSSLSRYFSHKLSVTHLTAHHLEEFHLRFSQDFFLFIAAFHTGLVRKICQYEMPLSFLVVTAETEWQRRVMVNKHTNSMGIQGCETFVNTCKCMFWVRLKKQTKKST